MLAGLSRHHQDIRDLHLRDLFASDPARGERLVAEGAGLYLDYSNQCGPSGAGHFVKKVHNGIEYGIMAAYAEGLNIIHSANIGKEVVEGDAETDPMEHPEYYQYDIDTREVAEVWGRGSVISSWLLDLTGQALHESPTLEDFSGVYRTPERDAGLRSRRSTRASRRRCSRPRFTRGLPRGGWTTTPTGCCPRCASSSEDTPRRCWTNVPLGGVRAMSVIADFGHEKRPVAGAAADIVERGMIVGLRTGSTVAYLLRALAAQGLDVRCPPTSLATERTTPPAEERRSSRSLNIEGDRGSGTRAT